MNYILIRFLATGRQTYNGLLLRLLNHAYTFMSIFEETVRLIDIWLNSKSVIPVGPIPKCINFACPSWATQSINANFGC